MIRGPIPNSCTGCPLADDHGNPRSPVRGEGNPKPKYVVIGEGPGRFEIRQGRPFIGPSGQLLDKAIKKTGVARSELYITNTTLCLPPTANKDAIVAKAATFCRARLVTELESLPDTPVLLVGKHAAGSIIGDKDFKIMEMAGTYHEIDFEGIGRLRCIPVVHPAMMLRGGDRADMEFWRLQYHLDMISRLADDKLAPEEYKIDIEGENTLRVLALVGDFIHNAWLVDDPIITLDTETYGPSPDECTECADCQGHSAVEARHAKLTAIGLATPEYAVSVAWSACNQATRQLLRWFFADQKLTVIAHNRQYDEIVMARHDMPIRGRKECTQLMHHSAFPGLGHKLQQVVSQFLLVPAWKTTYKKGKEVFSTEAMTELLTYNAMDTINTARVHSHLVECVDGSKAHKTYASDLRMADIAFDMHMNGVPYDRKINGILSERFQEIMQENKKLIMARLDDKAVLEKYLFAIAAEQAKKKRKADSVEYLERRAVRLEEVTKKYDAGKLGCRTTPKCPDCPCHKPINLHANAQVSALLQVCGVPLSVTTAGGALSTNKEVLEGFMRHPLVREFSTWKTNAKLFSTFIRPAGQLLTKAGRVHPTWSVNKITGRWGSSPNHQNFPKDKNVQWDKDEARTFENWLKKSRENAGLPNLRWQVVAPEGWIFVSGDFAQLEARVVAILSGDEYLCRAFREGIDIHSEFAIEIFPSFADLDPKDRKKDPRRDHTKRAEYGYLYGAAPQTVWQALLKEGYDISLQVVFKMFRTFQKRMPGVSRWHAQLDQQVYTEGRIKSFVMGRSRWFPMGTADPTIVKNFTVQSSGADIMNKGLANFDDVRPADCQILLQGHDSLTVLCRLEEKSVVSSLLEQVMTQEFTVSGVTMQFPFEMSCAKSWGDL